MKAVLVKGTKISFKIDKELIKDKTPNEEVFYYPNGMIDFVKENINERKKIISKFFHIEIEFNFNENVKYLQVSMSKKNQH